MEVREKPSGEDTHSLITLAEGTCEGARVREGCFGIVKRFVTPGRSRILKIEVRGPGPTGMARIVACERV